MKYMDSGNSQPNLSGNGQPIVSGGSQFGNQPQQSQPVIQTSTPQQPVPQMQGPISSGSGDIVLPTSEKKSKKGLIIGVVVGAIVVLCVSVALILNFGNFGSKQFDSFNVFANYFLYGKDSDEEINGYFEYGASYFINTLSSTDQISSFLQEVMEKYNKYLEVTSGSLYEESQEYAAILELYVYLNNYPVPGLGGIISEFVENSDDLASNIGQYFNSFDGAKYTLTQEYGQSMEAMAMEVIKALSIYDNKGCIDVEQFTVSNVCKINNDGDIELGEANDIVDDYLNKQYEMSEVSVDVYKELWSLKEIVYELKG